jgi:hypothetical protein
MRVQDQKVANQGQTEVAPFWGENQLVQTLYFFKKELKRRAHDLRNQDAS